MEKGRTLREEFLFIKELVAPIRTIQVEKLPYRHSVVYHQTEKYIYKAGRFDTVLLIDIETYDGTKLVRALYHFGTKAVEVVKEDFPTYKKSFLYGALISAIQKMGTEEPREQDDTLLAVQKRLQALKENRHFLDEEEWHLITETIPRDMETFRATFHDIDDDLLEASERYQSTILAEWHRQLDMLEESIRTRQLRKMVHLEALVKQRGKRLTEQKAATKES